MEKGEEKTQNMEEEEEKRQKKDKEEEEKKKRRIKDKEYGKESKGQ